MYDINKLNTVTEPTQVIHQIFYTITIYLSRNGELVRIVKQKCRRYSNWLNAMKSMEDTLTQTMETGIINKHNQYVSDNVCVFIVVL